MATVTSDGRHQPGIAERTPAHLIFTVYDLTAADPAGGYLAQQLLEGI
ncbi:MULTISPECIES: hypothetical protein [Protofrankia]|nr:MULTISPECIES: hypothetical protein [Protofrankia]